MTRRRVKYSGAEQALGYFLFKNRPN